MSGDEISFLAHVGEGIEHPHYGGDVGYDLICAERALIWPGEFADVDCDVAVALPEGHGGLVASRSSTFRERRLLVIQGVIDGGYRGPIKIGLFNAGRTSTTVEPGDELAQLIVLPAIKPTLRRVDELPPGDRGQNGMGSTSRD